MSHLGRTLEERFWEKVDKSGACWLWTAGKNKKGYGKFHIAGRPPSLAHRVSYELANGFVPNDLFVCHNCPGGDNPSCVNPAHLFLGTNTDNVRDMIKKGRAPFQSLTHCVNGHELTKENSIYPKSGGRECRTCVTENRRRWRAKAPYKKRPLRTPEQQARENEAKKRRRAQKKAC